MSRTVVWIGRACQVAAVGLLLLLVASFIQRSGGDEESASPTTTSPPTTLRPPPPPPPDADTALADVLGATAAPAGAAVVESTSFDGPVIIVPPTIQVSPRGETRITQVSVRDNDARSAGAEIGVILYTPDATFEITDPSGAYQHQGVGDSRGTFWMPITGTVNEINGALASVVYHAYGEVGPHLVIVAGDWLGHDGAIRKTFRTVPLRPLL